MKYLRTKSSFRPHFSMVKQDFNVLHEPEKLVFRMFTLGDIHARLAHRANRLCSPPHGRGMACFPSLFHAWIWVPDVNTLITPVTQVQKIDQSAGYEPASAPSGRWNLVLQDPIPVAGGRMLFFKIELQNNLIPQ